jgi:uncharacterized protein (TIGR03435 family)
MEASKMTLEVFAQMISRFLDRPVLDLTGLKGNFQIAVDISMEKMMSADRAVVGGGVAIMPGGAEPGRIPSDAVPESPSGGAIFQSVPKMGLKLEPCKAPLDRLVVDKLEKLLTTN